MWEYKMVKVSSSANITPTVCPDTYKRNNEKWLNEQGAEGWELCMYGSGYLTFKRRKRRRRIETNPK